VKLEQATWDTEVARAQLAAEEAAHANTKTCQAQVAWDRAQQALATTLSAAVDSESQQRLLRTTTVVLDLLTLAAGCLDEGGARAAQALLERAAGLLRQCRPTLSDALRSGGGLAGVAAVLRALLAGRSHHVTR